MDASDCEISPTCCWMTISCWTKWGERNQMWDSAASDCLERMHLWWNNTSLYKYTGTRDADAEINEDTSYKWPHLLWLSQLIPNLWHYFHMRFIVSRPKRGRCSWWSGRHDERGCFIKRWCCGYKKKMELLHFWADDCQATSCFFDSMMTLLLRVDDVVCLWWWKSHLRDSVLKWCSLY